MVFNSSSSMDTKNLVPKELDHFPPRIVSTYIQCTHSVHRCGSHSIEEDFYIFPVGFFILHYSLLTATLSLIIVFGIYDQNDKCFHIQRLLITITSQKSSPLWPKGPQVTYPVQLTEAERAKGKMRSLD